MPIAEIITIGTELLLGETIDTNTATLARALRGLGIDLYRTMTIGDNVQRIAAALQEALSRADILITTGGLGPTVDDPTREAVALAVGVTTEFHPKLWEEIVARVAAYGRVAGENQKRQAYIPKGAIPLSNPVGTAPAFIVETQDEQGNLHAIISLPGVPREMEYLLHHAVIPYLQQRFHLDTLIKVRTLHTAGLGEAMIDEQIGDLEKLSNPTVGLAAHSGIVDIRITAKAQSEAEADQMIAPIESELRARLGKAIFGADQETLEEVTFGLAARLGLPVGALEHGLEGALTRRLHRSPLPALLKVEETDTVQGEALAQALEKLCNSCGAKAGLAVSAWQENIPHIEIIVKTPSGLAQRHLTYGGHPQNLARWAVNMGLDFLRRELLRIS
ncbi:MAG: competence/damage-inducible protein A [Anaerolineales bacterium]